MHFFYDLPDVQTGIDESQRAIDLIRSGSRDLVSTHFENLRSTLFDLKHPPQNKSAFDDSDQDEIPF